jgi:hypothetical protein
MRPAPLYKIRTDIHSPINGTGNGVSERWLMNQMHYFNALGKQQDGQKLYHPCDPAFTGGLQIGDRVLIPGEEIREVTVDRIIYADPGRPSDDSKTGFSSGSGKRQKTYTLMNPTVANSLSWVTSLEDALTMYSNANPGKTQLL